MGFSCGLNGDVLQPLGRLVAFDEQGIEAVGEKGQAMPSVSMVSMQSHMAWISRMCTSWMRAVRG